MSPGGSPHSAWIATAPSTNYPPLTEDLAVDVAIVGAGITGLTAAALLADGGQTVAVLERARIGSGTSGFTTAHLDMTTDAGLQRLIDRYGEAGARLTIEVSDKAIDLIGELTRRYGIDCDYDRVPAWIYAENNAGREWLEQEHAAAKRLGLTTVLEQDSPLPFPISASLRIEGEGRFHIMRYLAGLAQGLAGATGGRCRIFESTPVTAVEDGVPCRVQTPHGTVTARDVILATHSPIGLRLALHSRLIPWRSYVLGVRVGEPVIDGLYWDTADPYHYLRPFSSDQSDLLLIGGEDHKTGHLESGRDPFARLEAYTRERFDVMSIEYRWSAELFVPVDHLPFIGLDVGANHLYVATGYAGTGMTFGTVAAMLCRDLILDRPNAARDLFTPARVNLVAAAPGFVQANVGVAYQFIKERLTHGAQQRIGQLAPGEGKIVELEGEKVAVYRDGQNQVSLLSPVCPHAKCLVVWNPLDKTWDCPCHGSIFAPTGEVISGPAMHGLSPLEHGAPRRE